MYMLVIRRRPGVLCRDREDVAGAIAGVFVVLAAGMFPDAWETARELPR